MAARDNLTGADNQQERLVLLGYLAGIIDGEGWIGIAQSNFGRQLRPIIAVHMVGEDTLLHLSSVCTSLGWESNLWLGKDSGRWSLNGSMKISQALPELTPILFVKQRQALLVEEFIALRKLRPLRSEPSARELAIREEISSLNVKGKQNNPRARILRDYTFGALAGQRYSPTLTAT